MRRILLVVVVLFAFAPCATAHTGIDWFLLTHDGKFLRQPDWGKEAVVDVETEQTFRLKDGKITAFRWADEKPVWTVTSPVAGRWDVRWVTEVPGVLLLIDERKATTKAIHGFDKATGKERYVIPLGDGWLPPPYQSSFEWPSGPDREGGRALYLVYPEKPDGRPKALAKFDLAAGKRLWEVPLLLPREGGFDMILLKPGVLHGRKTAYYFDPTTGLPLAAKGVQDTLQLAYLSGVLYRLSGGAAATLTAHRPGSLQELWSVRGLQGVHHILKPHTQDRLLCATDTEIVVLDPAARRERSRFPAIALPYAEIVHTSKAIVVMEKRGYRAVDPGNGKTIWRYESKAECYGLRLSGEQLLAIEDAPADETAPGVRRDRKLTAVALAAEDGKVRWRWPLPELKQFHDGTTTEILPCRAGILVKRWWFIGER